MVGWFRNGVLMLAAAMAPAAPAASQDGETIAALEQGCTAGDAAACNKLGARVYNGDGVAVDQARAADLFTRGCDGDIKASCRNLGVIYASGLGRPQDKARAAQFYTKACDLGDATGCGMLGGMYAAGEGVAADQARAVALYDKACSGGSARGCMILGGAYYNGEEVAKDPPRAVDYFALACDAGDAVGCRNAGVMIGQGDVVGKNVPRAALFYGRACTGGDEQGCGVVEAMKSACVSSYSEIAREGEFGPDKPKIMTFMAKIGGDAHALYGETYAGLIPSKAVVDQPLTEGSEDLAMNRIEPGEAQIVIWGDGASRYVHKSPELTDTAAALAQVEAVCGLIDKGIVLDSVNSLIVLATYSVPAE